MLASLQEEFAMKVVVLSALLAVLHLPAFAQEAPPKEQETATENLLKPTADVESWLFETTEGGEGKMEVVDDAIVFHITKTDDTNWHVQAYQTELDLEEGKDYVLKFQMKAAEPLEVIALGIINEEDWHEIGLHENIYPDKEYQDFEIDFTATDVIDGNNRIGFVLGAGEGVVSVKNMTLTEAK
jgi:hypothetical protein